MVTLNEDQYIILSYLAYFFLQGEIIQTKL